MDGQITVTLTRPDEGVILVNSVAKADYRTISDTTTIVWNIKLYTAAMWAIGVDLVPIPNCVEIPAVLTKVCSAGEWTALNVDANALILLQGWYKAELEALPGVGVGNVTIL